MSDLLPLVKAPTLVLHCRDDAVQPFDEGRRVAAGIPGARFVALEGKNHVPLHGEPAWTRLSRRRCAIFFAPEVATRFQPAANMALFMRRGDLDAGSD